MKTKLLSFFLIAAMLFTLVGCSTPSPEDGAGIDRAIISSVAENSNTIHIETNELTAPEAEPGSWAVYWYLCGSDLETNYGCATYDLIEMLEADLPENVEVVIQTGGADIWQNDTMDASKIQRWLCDSQGLYLVDEQPLANMGDAQTLYDFLNFAQYNFPAEKTAVLFWNHGGGSVTGASFDENYSFDSLNLLEMYAAFDAVWPADKSNPALELVGFDTCLMATIDVAAAFQPFAKYLAASEEVEPGNGWYYTGWLSDLAANPDMTGEELGISMCTSYYEGCEAAGTQGQTTLSLTDLTRLGGLLKAYESFGQEALEAAVEDPAFFAELGRAASQSENYGGNTRDQGYTNMVDLGHLARQTAWMLPSAQGVTDALEDCIVYKVNGPYRREATGLSCFYSYNGDPDNFSGYLTVGAGEAFKHLYTYGLTGQLSAEGEEYLEEMDRKVDLDNLVPVPTLEDVDWQGFNLELNEDGAAVMDFGAEAYDILSGVGFSLYYVDEENDEMLMLGFDNDMTGDWDTGVFTDNFRGVWGAIDGCMVYMELTFDGDDYNLYSVPVLLNDQLYYLQVAYDFNTEEWSILGACQALDMNGMASKEMRQLEPGDVLTTIWKMASYAGEEDFEMYKVEEIPVTEETAFGEVDLFDGAYTMFFEAWDSVGNYIYSEPLYIDIIDGEMWTTLGFERR